ncbi:hypothetical protein VTJ49DRAFT_3611 [Mycothermus thermophilus]|uniref:Oxidase ustYa n=1 Tax=Humicola insolens TaxID=85995 RepID=A0ABR3VM57_HUMIN
MGLNNHGTDEEEQEFLPKPRSTHDANAETDMAATIAYLVAFKPFVVTRDRILRTPVPQFPRKVYTFKPDDRLVNKEMWFNQTLLYHTLHNWVELSSDSRGYVVIPDSDRYDLPTPYDVPIDRHTTGPGYMMSLFHEMHCLTYIVEHFQKGYAGEKLTDDVAYHASHCIEYLLNGIRCCGASTLEGENEFGPGMGQRECVDYEALLEWANAHSAMKWNTGLMPGETIL